MCVYIYITCCVFESVSKGESEWEKCHLRSLNPIRDWDLSLSLSHTQTENRVSQFMIHHHLMSWFMNATCMLGMHAWNQPYYRENVLLQFMSNSFLLDLPCYSIIWESYLLLFHDSSPFFFFPMINENYMYVGYVRHQL